MENKVALIISLNFRAAHISHLVASYYQMSELGYTPICLIHHDAINYLPQNVKYITSINEISRVDVAIFWFPALGNIKLMWKLKHMFGAKIVYVFHEPIEKFSTYLASGNSRLWTIKFFAKYYVGLSFLMLADKIILPSRKAVELYENGLSKFANRNYGYLPLLYSDERDPEMNFERKYFSYIGSINNDHAYGNYVDYIYSIFKRNRFSKLKFLIASWRDVPEDSRIKEMTDCGILKVVSGKPMTNEEINEYYISSFLVWNAYHRSTQSGVLAKSFMFGTPGLVMKHNLSEFVVDGREVKAIACNSDIEELDNALEDVLLNFSTYSSNARKNYERNYDYRIHNKKMDTILNSL